MALALADASKEWIPAKLGGDAGPIHSGVSVVHEDEKSTGKSGMANRIGRLCNRLVEWYARDSTHALRGLRHRARKWREEVALRVSDRIEQWWSQHNSGGFSSQGQGQHPGGDAESRWNNAAQVLLSAWQSTLARRSSGRRADRVAGWVGRGASTDDIVAGLSVALLVIPQSMAYAELAGLSSIHGLYASALPLVAAGLFASCPYLQSGPVALTALLTHGALVTIAAPGTRRYAGAAAILAIIVGATRLAISIVRAGKVTYLMSHPVIRGFTSGAAVLILLSQFPSTLGLSPVGETGLVGNTIRALSNPSSWNIHSLVLAALTIYITLHGRKIHPFFPGALVAVVGGLVFSLVSGYEGPVVGDIPGSLPPFRLALPWSLLPTLIVPGVVIALVGFAETAVIARGYATQDRASWSPDREFLAQGAANVISGICGGMPTDGSLSRSSLNHLSGATSRWSGVITGLAVLLFLPFSGVLSALPKAVLAGIVIAAVVGLVRPQVFLNIWRISNVQGVVLWLTFALCILLAPRIEQALLLGVLLSLAIHVWRERRAGFHGWTEGEILHLEVSGILWFASAPRLEEALMQRLADAKGISEIILHLEGLGRIDFTGALVLKRVVDETRSLGIKSSLDRVPDHARELIDNIFALPPESNL